MCFNQPVSSNCDRKFVDSLETPCGWANLFNSFKELRMVWMLGMSASEEKREERNKPVLLLLLDTCAPNTLVPNTQGPRAGKLGVPQNSMYVLAP